MAQQKGLRAIAIMAVLVVSGAAGCFGRPGSDAAPEPEDPPLEALTEDAFEFGRFLMLKVASHDGVQLHVDLQLPEGEGPFPTLLEYTPYALLGDEAWGASQEHDLGLTGNDLADAYVPRGYAVGVAHVRGTGESGGCLTIGSEDEGKDGYAIVEDLAKQPWSNGKIALLGTSYVGTTPIETAVLAPPHLTTIIPISAVTNWYRYYFENGEQRMNGDPPPGASYPDPALWMALGVVPGPRTLAADVQDGPCVADYTRQYWLQDDFNAFWKARNHSAKASKIVAPVLYAQGFRDENVASNMITEWWHEVPSEKRAWFQQNTHGVRRISYPDWHEYMHRWLDHWMLNRSNGALDLPPVVVQDNRGKFRAEDAWPPADLSPMRLHLAGSSKLAPERPADGSVRFTDDGVGGMDASLLGTTWVRFESEPMNRTLLVAGEPLVHLAAASDSIDTQFTVLVYDRDPSGAESFLTRGYLDARHRESLESGADVVPGQRNAYEWRLHPRDHAVEKGHRLVVVVKSSDPYIIPDATRATNTIYFGANGSWIDFPVAEVDNRTFASKPPLPSQW